MPNLKKLSPSQLDKLIAEAVQLRAEMGHPATPLGNEMQSLQMDHWHLEYVNGQTLFCLWVPGLGWRGFFINPQNRATFTAAFKLHTDEAIKRGHADKETVSAASALSAGSDKKLH